MKLTNNVLIVEGSIRACIYDLNNRELYNINRATCDGIKFLLGQKEKTELDQEGLFELKKFLVNNDLVNKNVEKIHFAPPLFSVAFIETTSKCNHKCVHCYNEKNVLNKKEIQLKDFCRAIDQLKTISSIDTLKIIGGEPLFLNSSKFISMLSYVDGKFEKVEILSNLSLLTKDVIQKIKQVGNISFTTTLFSTIPEEFDKCTGVKGSFDRVMKNIEILQKEGISVKINYIAINNVLKGNIEKLYNGKKDYIRLSGKGNLGLYNKQLLSERVISKQTFAKKLNPNKILRNLTFNQCFSNSLYVDVELNVFPCAMERRLLHGNIQERNLIQIINEDICRFNKDKIKGCNCCEYRYACFDCRPDSIGKDIDEKPWYCTYDPQLGVWDTFEDFVSKLEKKYNIKIGG